MQYFESNAMLLEHACSHLKTWQCYCRCACLCGCWEKYGYILLKGVKGKKTTSTTVLVCIACTTWLMWRTYKRQCPHHEECDDGRQHTLTLNVMESSMDEYPKLMINYSNTPCTSWNLWDTLKTTGNKIKKPLHVCR